MYTVDTATGQARFIAPVRTANGEIIPGDLEGFAVANVPEPGMTAALGLMAVAAITRLQKKRH